MMSLIGNIIGFIGKLVPMLFAWKAGKSSAQAAILEQEAEIVEKSNELERDIDRASDADVSKRLRDAWTKQK